jgi:hypothetical protein
MNASAPDALQRLIAERMRELRRSYGDVARLGKLPPPPCVAATTLGTTVPEVLRGTASGIINTAAQLGTAVGIAALLLIADATTGAPGPGTGAPVIAWAAAAAIAAAGALVFTRSPQPDPATTGPAGPKADTNPAADNTQQTRRDDGVTNRQRVPRHGACTTTGDDLCRSSDMRVRHQQVDLTEDRTEWRSCTPASRFGSHDA